MSDSTIDIQPSPKNSSSSKDGKVDYMELLLKIKRFMVERVWQPAYAFISRLWNRYICNSDTKDEPSVVEMPQVTSDKDVSANDTVLVHRNTIASDEKIQAVEKDLNEISVMRISRSASISSIIKDDYVGSN